MPRLFIKIFLWFWLAMTIIGAILVTLALNTDPGKAFLERQKSRLTGYGRELVRIYEKQGPEGLTERVLYYHKKHSIRLVLISLESNSLVNQPPQPFLQEFARKALIGNLVQPFLGGLGQQIKQNNHRFAIPLDDNYVLLTEMPQPSRLELLLDPHALTIRLGVTFLIAGLICYLLARSITTPIIKLRQATQKFASGELATRVSPHIGQQKGEIAELALDFDTMATRIEDLLNSQHRLLRDISHELRSPLARLSVALELARRDNSSGNNSPLDRIEKEGERLNELIGQLLTITRLEVLSEVREKESINLREILEQVVEDANYESQGSDRKVLLTDSPSAITLVGSFELLSRAMENIIRNALHYTPDDSTVDVSSSVTEDKKMAVITIRDHGPGVPPESLTLLFKPFYRVSESRDQRSGGTGVGLAIAERAIKLHGGTITAMNAPEGGLMITVKMPVAE